MTDPNPNDRVDTPAPAHGRMMVSWNLIDSLCAKTPGMRGRGEDLLPRNPRESTQDHKKRVEMSFLHPGFTRAVRRVVARSVAKQLTVQNEEKLSPRLQGLIRDVDGTGKTMHQLAADLLEDGWKRGLHHVGVDVPIASTVSVRTRAAEPTKLDEMGIVPRIFRIDPPKLFNWPYTTDETGRETLKQIRFRETGTKADGQWALVEIDRIRVWNAGETEGAPGNWQLFEAVEGKPNEYAEVGGGSWNYPGIPLVTGYFAQLGFMEAESPFEPIAWLNLAHWQSSSRQRWLLDFARLPFLFGKGWTKKEIDAGITLAANVLTASPNPNADVKVIEHEGKAIGAGQDDVDDLERRMDAEGLKPMQTQGGTPTAAGRWLDEASTMTEAQENLSRTEDTLTQALRVAGRWIKEEVPDDVRVKLPADITMHRTKDDIPAIESARADRILDARSYFEELQDRGVLRDDLKWEEVERRLTEESPDEEMLAGARLNGDIDPIVPVVPAVP